MIVRDPVTCRDCDYSCHTTILHLRNSCKTLFVYLYYICITWYIVHIDVIIESIYFLKQVVQSMFSLALSTFICPFFIVQQYRESVTVQKISSSTCIIHKYILLSFLLSIMFGNSSTCRAQLKYIHNLLHNMTRNTDLQNKTCQTIPE